MGELIEHVELRDKYAVFEDRGDAGRRLAVFLRERGVKGDLVLAIPNGGVAVGAEVSISLGLRLAVAVTRKITFPWTTEAGFGAVSWTGEVEVDASALRYLGEGEYEKCLSRVRRSVEERVRMFKEFLPPSSLAGVSVLLVDDGLATGYTMLVAVKTVKKLGAGEVTVAVPTASQGAVELLLRHVDRLVVLNLRTGLPYAVADAYKFWRDLSEHEVLAMLYSLRKLGLA